MNCPKSYTKKYDTKAEAQAAFEATMNADYGMLRSIKVKKSKKTK